MFHSCDNSYFLLFRLLLSNEYTTSDNGTQPFYKTFTEQLRVNRDKVLNSMCY